MKKLFFSMLSWISLQVLRLRYDIDVKNRDLLKIDKNKGTLFLPNHPALIDPIIISSLLFKDFAPRPIALRAFFHVFGVRFILKCVKAFPFPDFDLSSNMWKVRQVEKVLEEVYKGLKHKEHFLIYPSGRLTTHGSEEIGGNSFVYNLLQKYPSAQIVLIRTVGLWGSSFSRAQTGKSPIFFDVFKMVGLNLLKNGIFFMPRRKVTIEFFSPSKDFFKFQPRLDFNRQLEKWYNQFGTDQGSLLKSEPLSLVSWSRFSKQLPSIKKDGQKRTMEDVSIAKEKKVAVTAKLAALAKCNPDQITEKTHLFRDLGLDSLDLAEIRAFLEGQFGAQVSVSEKLETVLDLYHALAHELNHSLKLRAFIKTLSKWPKEPVRPDVLLPEGKTIQEVFLKTAKRMGKHIACADSRTHFLSYKQFLIAAIVLAKKFSKLRPKQVGVSLPSSAACYLVIVALLLSGKVPVILNWTDGKRNLNFAKKSLGLKAVVTSYYFLEHAQVVDFGDLDKNLIFLENIKQSVTFFDKCFAFLLGSKDPDKLHQYFNLSAVDEHDPAAILFTSGSESYPKAVPLSHKNILSNQKAALEAVTITKKDLLYGVLPPFHSFGLSATGVFPLLSGLKVFYSSDPTDTQTMVQDIFQNKITIICLAPTFYKNLLQMATKRHLRSVRLFISGAEKAPEGLVSKIEALSEKNEWIEGYGVTECSPIVTLNRPGLAKRGVGKPLFGVEVCIIDPETGKKISGAEEGEICIKGSSVFNGYIGEESPDPFIEINHEKWYKSGDLGKIDSDGFLILSGRLKRFIKIKGEMVSLLALEEEIFAFSKKCGYIEKDVKTPQLVIGVKETKAAAPSLILFTTFDIKKEDVNHMLVKEGYSRVAKISEVKHLESIPVTGIGKVQFGAIDHLARQSNEGTPFS